MKKTKEHKTAKEFVKEISNTIDLRNRINDIVFNAHTPLGKLFDIVIMLMIIASIITIVLHSIPSVNHRYHTLIYSLDWFFTVCFLVEYCLRVYSAKNRKQYAFGMWGIIDFLAVFPSIISLWITGYQTIQVIRIVRLLRVFKVLRLFRFISEGYALAQAMKASLYKIAVFMSFIFILVVLLGSFMYVIEDGTPGFESIPSSIYWGIVTITTVGFGDIVPHTMIGKFTSSVIMLAGYAIIAVPTGIITGEVVKQKFRHTIKCFECDHENDYNNKFCSECGDSLLEEKTCE
ncbi:MAG: ion transporter [Flavobacteriia bacterium]|nr:ion transporter [Flavobacteriia bacterium]OJX37075.1 MAG: ion transporter [Flavobacteriia bacterium 40-80]